MGLFRTLFSAILQAIDQRSSSRDTIAKGNAYRIRQLVENEYDLMQMDTHYPTCAECSKYQGRVYSLSGKDKRFPALSTVPNKGRVHKGCRHVMTAWIESLQEPEEVQGAIERSRRPFEDVRSDEEKALKQKQIDNDTLMQNDRREYDSLVKALGDRAPKSFGGYRRMKVAKSKNYLALVDMAAAAGILIK